MARFTDEEIINANGGKIESGDRVLFRGPLNINWTSKDLERVNLLYETNTENGKFDTSIAKNINTSPDIINTYNWAVTITSEQGHDLPYKTFRIKIVSPLSNAVVSYSNYFKISKDILFVEV